ncbi:MAG: acyl-ACP--UDP-N-acetylglucosamine O-acyltransferase [Pseudomonadota bacterium]
MSVEIDKLAVVNPGAEIGDGCVIGPYCTIADNVRIGPGTKLRAHVYVDEHTTIGADCDVFPYVTLGVESQDMKYEKGSRTYARIGDRNVIREFVSVHRGTDPDSQTRIGSDCVLLAHSHVAHNCAMGDHVVLSHSATLGGHVEVDDYANLGGLSAVHQHCRVGRAAMIAGMSRVIQDVLPYTIAEGFPAHMRIVNKIGMERAGYTGDCINDVRKAFRMLFLREMRLDDAVAALRDEFGDRPHVTRLIDFIEASSRGLARPESAMIEMNTAD